MQLLLSLLMSGWMPINMGWHRGLERDNLNGVVLTVLVVVGLLRALWSVYQVHPPLPPALAPLRSFAPPIAHLPPTSALVGSGLHPLILQLVRMVSQAVLSRCGDAVLEVPERA
jgi:hypothetical protein